MSNETKNHSQFTYINYTFSVLQVTCMHAKRRIRIDPTYIRQRHLSSSLHSQMCANWKHLRCVADDASLMGQRLEM
jgi:hypothetical protein